MAIQKEIWAADIAERLFPNDSWMQHSTDDSAFVENRRVHLAQSGALPTVEVNRVYTGAQVVAQLRVDTDADYTIDEHTTTPVTIPDIEITEVNYNKRQSVIGSHAKVLNLSIANRMQYSWAPTLAANLIRTTGTAAPAQVIGATGNRKPATIEDFLKLKGIFDDMDVDEMDRHALVPSFMLNDFIANNKTLLTNLNLSGDAIFANGNLKTIFGFAIHTRGKKNILTYDGGANPAPRIPGAAALATANAAILAWSPEYVRRALGAVKVFESNQNPFLYGDGFSALARAGGKKWYDDQTGVVALVEA